MVSLAYSLLAVPYLAVPTVIAQWVLGGWMPVESVDEPIDHMALTIAGIPVEDIWPDPDEVNQVLSLDVEQELARLVAARLRAL